MVPFVMMLEPFNCSVFSLRQNEDDAGSWRRCYGDGLRHQWSTGEVGTGVNAHPFTQHVQRHGDNPLDGIKQFKMLHVKVD